MNTKRWIALLVGIVVIVATYSYYSARINSIAPTEERINQVALNGTRADVNALMVDSEKAKEMQNTFLFVAGVEAAAVLVVTFGVIKRY